MRIVLALALVLSAGGAIASTDASWMGVKGATAERVHDRILGGEIVVYRAGRSHAPPVLLVHGLGPSGARDWRRIVPALAAHHAVWALDLPGFGASTKGDALYSPDQLAQVIDGAVAPRIGRPFAVLGHSLGAAVALAYAAAYPARVERLILADMAGVLHGSVYAEFLARFGMQQVTGVYPDGAPGLDPLLRGMLARIDRLPIDRELLLRTPALRQRLFRGEPAAIAAYALGEHDFSAALRSVRAPTLVVWGSDDRVAPLRTGRLAAATIPGARLHVLDGIGHAPQLQAPDEFAAVILDELAGRPVGRTLPLPDGDPLAGGRTGVCDGEAQRRFSGAYVRLSLIRCTQVEIADASIGELRVLESEARIVNSVVSGGIYGLRSRIEITGGSVTGTPAVRLDESDLDVAGTRLHGSGALIINDGALPLDVRISVSEVQRGTRSGYVHDVVRLAPAARW